MNWGRERKYLKISLGLIHFLNLESLPLRYMYIILIYSPKSGDVLRMWSMHHFYIIIPLSSWRHRWKAQTSLSAAGSSCLVPACWMESSSVSWQICWPCLSQTSWLPCTLRALTVFMYSTTALDSHIQTQWTKKMSLETRDSSFFVGDIFSFIYIIQPYFYSAVYMCI